MKRTPFKRSRAPLRRRSRRWKAKVPPEVRKRVLKRTRGLCARPGCGRRAVHLHHVLAEEHYPDLALEEDNLIGACLDCHFAHENASRRFPRSALPPGVWELARLRCAPPAVWYLEKHYTTKEVSDG